MGFARRDLLKFAGGSAAGLVFTPAPWGLLHDTAVWSQNWAGIPQPPRGEIRTRYTTCTLCPAGCGARARCVGDQPVSLGGAAGPLCATGLVGHHLAFDPRRAKQPQRSGKPASIEEVTGAVRAAIGDSVAILDPRPGRAASSVYARFVQQFRNGVYCAPACGSPGLDLESTRAILSFGEPVLDGWLTPARVLANRSHFQLIQVEAAWSRTASLADLWVPIPPGAEAAFARDLATALERGAASDDRVARAARILTENKPAVAVGSRAPVAELNRILGSVFPRRRETGPAATNLEDVPDGSIRTLIVEESSGDSADWPAIERKLVPRGAVVVALTPWLDGCAKHADYVIPAPAYLEMLDEAPTPPGSAAASYSLSPALLASPPNTIAPADFILQVSQEPTTYLDMLKRRAAAIRKDGRGTLLTYPDAKSARVTEIASDEDFWKAMLNGAVWRDDTAPGKGEGFPDRKESAPVSSPTLEYPLMLAPVDGPRGHGSPLMTKVYQESGLRRPANLAVLNPETGRAHGLDPGCRAVIRTETGEYAVQVLLDAAVMRGVIEAAAAGHSRPATIRKA